MKNTLSILKPQVQNALMENIAAEKISYLKIPPELDRKALKADVKKGAVQFGELDQLLVKDNEPQYILIHTDNLEQGYLAVTYLAAGFNRKHGTEFMVDDMENGEKITEWEESPFRIPLVEEFELSQSMSRGNDNHTFSMNDVFMQGGQMRGEFTPYWMSCTNEAVCIVSKDCGMGLGYGAVCGNDDLFSLGLNHFQRNDKVYILHVENNAFTFCDDGDEEDEGFMVDAARSKWNYIVLSYAADEVSVSLKEDAEKKYYKLLIQGNFAANRISVKKGFSFERLVNMITAMSDDNKCKLVENIVKYAVKDWKSASERPIENRDFDFMDRFCRAYPAAQGRKGDPKRTAKERMMQELIGMEDVKQQVLNIVNVMKYNLLRTKMGIPGGGYHNVHVMLGAPGTAKTTVAQFMGQIMVEEHLLPDNRFVCVNGAELKGRYVGHSAPKTKALFDNNDIIVIDEAYSLVDGRGEDDSFTREALAQLIIELENHSTDKLVIFAGYGGKKVNEKNNKMKQFLDANPGLKSRITSTIYFDSYSPDEMAQIFFKIAENNHYHLDESVREMLSAYFRKRVLDDNFGNGREARSLLETSVIYTANRVLAQNKKIYTKAEMQTIQYEDVEMAIRQAEYAERIRMSGQVSKGIGFTAS